MRPELADSRQTAIGGSASKLKSKQSIEGADVMASNLKGKTIAILATDGFEQAELLKPKQALEEAGAKTQVISPTEHKIKGWEMKDWGKEVRVDVPLKSANASQYDALLLPGGVINADHLRMIPEAVEFVKHFVDQRKPMAVICHAPWMLVETGAVRGRTVTSWPSLKTDIQNAGGTWVDEQVVVSNGVVTSRKPDDIPAFNREMIEMFSGPVKSERKVA
jgi:protease I